MDRTVVELDNRKGGALEVSLLWHRDTQSVSLTIRDHRTRRSIELPVAHDRARQAFQHPFAYAASMGVDGGADLAVQRPATAAWSTW